MVEILTPRFTGHLYQLCTGLFSTKQSPGDGQTADQTAADIVPDEQARSDRPSSREASENTGDAENIPAAKETTPDHFNQLLLTPEPFNALRSLEDKLTRRKF